MKSKNIRFNFLLSGLLLAAFFIISGCDTSEETEDVIPDPILKPVAYFVVEPNDPKVGNVAIFNGIESSGKDITYQWTLQGAPNGSSAELVTPTNEVSSIIPDVAGHYEIMLCVTSSDNLDSCLQKGFDVIEQKVVIVENAGDGFFVDKVE